MKIKLEMYFLYPETHFEIHVGVLSLKLNTFKISKIYFMEPHSYKIYSAYIYILFQPEIALFITL